jgi:chromosome segregation ATPase
MEEIQNALNSLQERLNQQEAGWTERFNQQREALEQRLQSADATIAAIRQEHAGLELRCNAMQIHQSHQETVLASQNAALAERSVHINHLEKELEDFRG